MKKELELLSGIATAFSESLNLEKTLQAFFRSLDKHLGLKRATISFFDEESGTINIKLAYGLSDRSIRLGIYQMGEGITGTVVQTGKEIVVPDIEQDKRFLHRTRSRKLSSGRKIAFYCVPVKLQGKTIGALSVDKVLGEGESLKDNLTLLKVIATMVAQPIKLNKLVEGDRRKLEEENRKLREDLKTKFSVHNMIGTGNAMQEVYRLIGQVAESNATVLIRGESGTGKDLVAHAIHFNSYRKSKPFIKINCTAIPDTLLESELFGHEQGAFTDAKERKIGRFERAHGGTIFLDEIGDFSMTLQVKLLRVVQFKEFERVGGTETIKSNVRIVVATNKELEKEIEEGTFREDLYYRINVFPIFLPSLRERKDDIMLLADFFLEKYAKENKRQVSRISTPAINMITSYHWPGNIRELENCMERAVLVCQGDVIRSEHLPPSLQMAQKEPVSGRLSLTERTEILEKELIVDALKISGGQQRKAARELGISERILGYKIKKHKILTTGFKR
ncbi:MAG: sigma-54 interaction domain-containing protein [Nitrospinota bacterium]